MTNTRIHHCNQCEGPTSFVRLLAGWGWTCNYCPAWGSITDWHLRMFDNDREPA